ncbi:Mss4-like protein [Xylariaceae sp. FL0662B]|nr:Mss4-like protein [Xylariaceae sp. FL0662B]
MSKPPIRAFQSGLRRHHHRSFNTPFPTILSTTFTPLIQKKKKSPAHHDFTGQVIAPYHHTTTPPPRTRGTTAATMASAADNEEDEKWKSKPPYRVTPADEQSDKRWMARCHCGRIRYWLSREKPLAAKFCHCVGCQALHGAPFQWAAIFEKADVHFERGAAGLAFYHAGAREARHRLPCKVSCAHCRAPIMDEGRRVALLFPGLIDFRGAAERRLFEPQCHIFYGQRVVDIPDGKPKWSGLDGQSELMEEAEEGGKEERQDPNKEHTGSDEA